VETDVDEKPDLRAVGEGDEFYDPASAPEDGGNESGGGASEDDGNGRKTLAELAAETPEPEDGTEDDDPQPMLFGSESKVTGSVKGKRPETSAVKFKASQVAVTGQFHFDDAVELRVLARLDKVEFVATRDRQGVVKGVKRVHHASAVTVEQVDLPADVLRRRAEFVADALGVDADALVEAQERAVAEVE
jgi:hypothetical protein